MSKQAKQNLIMRHMKKMCNFKKWTYSTQEAEEVHTFEKDLLWEMGINFKQHMFCDLNNSQGPHDAGDEKWEKKKAYWGEKEAGWETRI